MIKLFVNRWQIRLLNSKSTDLDGYYSRPYQKLKFLICDLLFVVFVKSDIATFDVFLLLDDVTSCSMFLSLLLEIIKFLT